MHDLKLWQEITEGSTTLDEITLIELTRVVETKQKELFRKQPILGGHKWFIVKANQLSGDQVALMMEDGHILHFAIVSLKDKILEVVWEYDG